MQTVTTFMVQHVFLCCSCLGNNFSAKQLLVDGAVEDATSNLHSINLPHILRSHISHGKLILVALLLATQVDDKGPSVQQLRTESTGLALLIMASSSKSTALRFLRGKHNHMTTAAAICMHKLPYIHWLHDGKHKLPSLNHLSP